MIRSLVLVAACAIIPLMATDPVKASADAPKLADVLAKADTDKDGSLSLAEVKLALAADKGDKEVQKDLEHTKKHPSKVDEAFAKADLDKNGKLSKDEIKAFETALGDDEKEDKGEKKH